MDRETEDFPPGLGWPGFFRSGDIEQEARRGPRSKLRGRQCAEIRVEAIGGDDGAPAVLDGLQFAGTEQDIDVGATDPPRFAYCVHRVALVLPLHRMSPYSTVDTQRRALTRFVNGGECDDGRKSNPVLHELPPGRDAILNAPRRDLDPEFVAAPINAFLNDLRSIAARSLDWQPTGAAPALGGFIDLLVYLIRALLAARGLAFFYLNLHLGLLRLHAPRGLGSPVFLHLVGLGELCPAIDELDA